MAAGTEKGEIRLQERMGLISLQKFGLLALWQWGAWRRLGARNDGSGGRKTGQEADARE